MDNMLQQQQVTVALPLLLLLLAALFLFAFLLAAAGEPLGERVRLHVVHCIREHLVDIRPQLKAQWLRRERTGQRTAQRSAQRFCEALPRYKCHLQVGCMPPRLHEVACGHGSSDMGWAHRRVEAAAGLAQGDDGFTTFSSHDQCTTEVVLGRKCVTVTLSYVL